MRRIISLLIVSLTIIFSVSSCRIDGPEGRNVSRDKLINHCYGLLSLFDDDMAPTYAKLMAIDSYEALSEEEKKDPAYSSFWRVQINYDGSRQYENYGTVKNNVKRLVEDGSIWVANNFTYKCNITPEGTYIWSFGLVNVPDYAYYDSNYDPDKCKLWLDEQTGGLYYEFEVVGSNSSVGFTSRFYTIEPVRYNIAGKNRDGKYRFESYDSSGQLFDWVEIRAFNSSYTFKTSRD